MSERLKNDAAVEHAVEALRGLRGTIGEVFFRGSHSTSVEVKDGAIENVLAHGERGIGVRVIDGQRVGFAYTSALSSEGVRACVDAAHAMSRVAEVEPDLQIATDSPPVVELGIHEDGERSVEDRAAVAVEVERVARAVDPRISGFRKTTFSDSGTTTIFATTLGAWGRYRESSSGVGTAAIATQGEERQIGGHGEASRTFSGVSAERVGRRAAEQAVGKLGARPFPTQRIAVVLDPWQGMQLVGAIGTLFNADSVLKGKSLFKGRIGERVASARVSVIDDARKPAGLRTAPFDGEGTPTRRRELIVDGTLQGYLTSLKTARKLGTEPTGNARRGSYAMPSRISPSNLHIANGAEDASAMVAGLDRALRITSLLNLHTIDPISGEFSLGAAGDYLERGVKQYAVQGITIAGNLVALLSSISGVGNDLTFGGGGIGSPTLVISELSVGGT
ncbi:MAG: TldD/PmbA family protein [Chloroflexi bacterium]|nr:TldD/PmbA family protein [Chloroflexota bacterium]